MFGTAQPLHGLSGLIRRIAYERYSEGQTAHWLLLVLGDRVDAAVAHVRSFGSRRPDDPLTLSGVLGERGRRPWVSRRQPGRVDGKHTWVDPIVILGPWVVSAAVVVTLVRSALAPSRRRRGRHRR